MIFYFSATGNTKWAAEQIMVTTRDRMQLMTTADTDIEISLEEGERLGFCFPVHGWRPPLIVRQFISRLKVNNLQGHFVYALCTAGDTIGETLDIFASDLKARGINLDAGSSLLMPESYVGLPFMDVDPSGREKQKIEAAQERVKWISEQIEARKAGITDLTVGPLPSFFSGPVGAFFVNHLITDRPFRVDEARCVRCGRCAQVCPVADIEGGKGLVPQWKHNGRCLTCFSCYHHCPFHAIDYGRRTQHKGQYFYGHKI